MAEQQAETNGRRQPVKQERDERPPDGKPSSGKDGDAGQTSVASPAKKSRKRIFILAGVAVALVAALVWWLHARHFEETDDAQVDGNLSAVSSRVVGTVTAVHVEDNQVLKAGDLLVELDASDLDVALAQARASVALAEAQLQAESPNVSITQTSNRASVASADDDIANARAELEAAQRDLDQAEANNRFAQQQRERSAQLIASHTIAQAEFDRASSAADGAAAAVASAKKRIDQRRARARSRLAWRTLSPASRATSWRGPLARVSPARVSVADSRARR
jgi:membrane fusion protein (multidrug efflux system)